MGTSHHSSTRRGLSLTELLVAVVTLGMAVVALWNAFTAEAKLVEFARQRTLASNDTIRVLEQLRWQNKGAGCVAPTIAPPAPPFTAAAFASWDAWLADSATGGGGKSLQAIPGTNEAVVVVSTGADPLQVTIAACWTHQGRAIGDCNPVGGISSPAMFTTSMTCRP